MPSAPVIVYDANMNKVAYLENARSIEYEMPLNGLWAASFSLPADDPKNAECQPLRFVEIYDGNERIDLFRILPATTRRDQSGKVVTYQCEHVLATLLDDVLYAYHQIGGFGVYTAEVLQYILDRQNVKRWQLGTVQFARQFEYSWEHETLLAALFSVPAPFIEEYQWTWDTTTYPWQLNLVVPSDEVTAHIRYGANLKGVTKEVDPTDLCTRLYCLGYGEGVNQLTIAEVNDGKPYLDADTQHLYGIITRAFVDRRFEDPATLKARGEALLNELKHPRVSYTVDAAALDKLSNEPLGKFRVGGVVMVKDPELGIEFKARVVNIRKSDLLGAPGDVQLEIANRPRDIAGSIAELNNRQHIYEAYAQGATNIDSHNFADNCDPNHPAVFRFYIPVEAVRINRVLLSYQVEPFRAYSRAIAGGGRVVTTTKAGGGRTVTSRDGGAKTVTSENGGADTVTSEAGGAVTNTYTAAVGGNFVYQEEKFTHGGPGDHQHRFWDTSVDFDRLANHTHRIDIPSHTHRVNLPAHKHQVVIPAHNHEIDLPDHTHDIEIPEHTHDIQHGIYEGPTPSQVTVSVDGMVIPGLGTNETDVDIVPYLKKDNSGRIERGAWHEIEIRPNNLGRIVANLVVQLFIQSRGGGNY